MKLPTILLLFILAMPRLQASADPAPLSPKDEAEWRPVILKAQTLFKQQRFAEAAESAKLALRIAKRYGPSDDHLAVTYYELGAIYHDWGHCAESRANYGRAVAAWEKQPNPKTQYLFKTIIGLLSTLCECEEFAAAEKTYRAYASKLQRYQSGPLDEAQLLSAQAIISRSKKNFGQAESYYRQTIQLLEQTPGSTLVQIEGIRSDLAMVIDKQRRHAEALAESEHVIAFFDHSGLRTPSLTASLNNAACSLADLGRSQDAERMFERALATAVDEFGEENRFTAKVMLNYARVLRENKESPAADAMQKKGADIFHRALMRESSTVNVEDLQPTK